MKFLLLAATVALAAAKADPWVYSTGLVGAPVAYAGLHAPLTYGLPYAPVVYTAAAGCQNDAGAVVPCAHGGLVGVVPAAPVAAAEPAVEEARKKREATAEAEADPEAEAKAWLFYRTVGYGHLAYSYAPYAYAGHYGYYGLGHHYGYYGRKKREATAEADAEASPEADP